MEAAAPEGIANAGEISGLQKYMLTSFALSEDEALFAAPTDDLRAVSRRERGVQHPCRSGVAVRHHKFIANGPCQVVGARCVNKICSPGWSRYRKPL